MRRWLVVAISGVGCGSGELETCPTDPLPLTAGLPERLSAAGLYEDIAAGTVSTAVLEFEPRFELWTDGAHKRRWLSLPEGASVDTRNPDAWVFPVGTRVFKEFERDGVRAETRMLERFEEGWGAVAYVWEADQSDAVATPEGVRNALGTPHDVPTEQECVACHGGRESFVLGFSAIQLSPDERASLHGEGVLSDVVSADPQLSEAELQGLGTLHANCSHCHNPTRATNPQTVQCLEPEDHDFTLPVATADAQSAPAWRTASEELGSASDSEILGLMEATRRRRWTEDRAWMPPIGTEEPDLDGAARVREMLLGAE